MGSFPQVRKISLRQKANKKEKTTQEELEKGFAKRGVTQKREG